VTLNTFLNFGGNCAQAFQFYEEHLGGRITAMMDRASSPDPGPGANLLPGWAQTIQYASIDLGGTALMGADVPAEQFQPMRSAYLSLTVHSIAEAERLYLLLAEGGQIFMKMEEQFFAHRFAMLRDRFGTNWMILHPKPMQG
jgi:PhnB protein